MNRQTDEEVMLERSSKGKGGPLSLRIEWRVSEGLACTVIIKVELEYSSPGREGTWGTRTSRCRGFDEGTASVNYWTKRLRYSVASGQGEVDPRWTQCWHCLTHYKRDC